MKNRLTAKHLTSPGPHITHQTIITTKGINRWLLASKSLVVYLRFHQNGKLGKFSRRRRLDDVLTTFHMRRKLARENFTSGRRRRAISLSMLKVPNVVECSVFCFPILTTCMSHVPGQTTLHASVRSYKKKNPSASKTKLRNFLFEWLNLLKIPNNCYRVKLKSNDNFFGSQMLRLYVLDVATLNSFINGVESLNTSLLLAVQRLAKTTENSSQESAMEGRDAGANEIGPGNVSFLPELRAENAKVEDVQHIEFLRSNSVLTTSWFCSRQSWVQILASGWLVCLLPVGVLKNVLHLFSFCISLFF